MNNKAAQADDHTACPARYRSSSAADVDLLKGHLAANLKRVRVDRI
jgi:hypothetical protein